MARIGHKPSAEAPPLERIEAPMDSIRAWLGVLVRLLRLPEGEAADIRDELEGHLRERTRDLMVGGMDEDAAVRSSIAELGNAAEVAARYRVARNQPRRRLLMNVTMLGAAASALVISVVALVQPGGGGAGQPRATVYTPAPPPAAVAGTKITGEFKDVPLAEALAFIAKSANKKLSVEWKPLEEVGAQRDSMITATLSGATLEQTLTHLSRELGLTGSSRLDLRATDDLVQIATVSHFDRLETRLVAYDMSEIYAKGIGAEEVFQLVRTLVEPDGWVDNGGDLAKGYGLGDRLFVEAPARYHTRIAWILGEVSPKETRAAAAPEAGPAVADTRSFVLRSLDAAALRDLLGLWFNTSPALRQCEVTRRMAADTNSNRLVVTATAGQLDLITRIVEALDRPAGDLPPPQESSKTFKLRHVKPSAARTLLEQVFNTSPALRQCAVGRSMACNDGSMTLDFTATSDQVGQVERLITLFDVWTVTEATKSALSEPRAGQGDAPRPTRQLVFRAENGQVVVCDSEGAVQIEAASIELTLPDPPAVPSLAGVIRLSHLQASVPMLRDIPILSTQFRTTRVMDFNLSR